SESRSAVPITEELVAAHFVEPLEREETLQPAPVAFSDNAVPQGVATSMPISIIATASIGTSTPTPLPAARPPAGAITIMPGFDISFRMPAIPISNLRLPRPSNIRRSEEHTSELQS